MRGFSAIGLYQPKTQYNIGGVLRAAGCFDASLIVVEGRRYQRATTDTTKMYRHIPLLHGELESMIPFDCIPVAVEITPDAQPLSTYEHPERAFYVFGPEDGSIPLRTIEWCRDVVKLPTNGCLNLAVTVNIVLYDRHVKRMALQEQHILQRKVANG